MKPPVRLCVVDIGSNAAKMRIAEVAADGSRKTLSEGRYAVRLGESFGSGQIPQQTIETMTGAFQEIAQLCRSFGVHRTRAVATSAAREATNSRDLIAAIQKHSGIKVELISGKEEARLLGWGVKPDMMAGRHNLLIDVGGGSTEFIYTRPSLSISSIRSVRLGAVRLQQWEKIGPRVSKKDFNGLKRLVEETLEDANLPVIARDTHAIGVAGTFGALLDAKHRGQAQLDATLTATDLQELLEAMVGKTPDELEAEFGIDRRRGQIIVPGGVVIAGVMDLYNLTEITVSGRGLRDGLLEELIESTLGEVTVHDTPADFAIRIGEKYDFDRPHGEHVANLSIQLFDDLQDLHDISDTWREPFRIAAILHDIGQFVNYSRHHKHSYYLLLNEELAGLTTLQQQVAATIARYHRRSQPLERHAEFTSLPEEARSVVIRCAAILRIADVLDRQHRQLVTSLTARATDKSVTITLKATGPVLLELSAAPKKSEMFEKVFGRRLQLDGISNENGNGRESK